MRHNRVFVWIGVFVLLVITIGLLAQVPDVRLRMVGAHHRHLKSGEWVIVDKATNLSDRDFSRLVDEIVRNGTYNVLSLSGSRISDAGFAPVSKLGTLDWIQFSDCKFSDEALHHLHGLPGLHTIEIDNCPNISHVGIAELQAALPDCHITYNDADP